ASLSIAIGGRLSLKDEDKTRGVAGELARAFSDADLVHAECQPAPFELVDADDFALIELHVDRLRVRLRVEGEGALAVAAEHSVNAFEDDRVAFDVEGEPVGFGAFALRLTGGAFDREGVPVALEEFLVRLGVVGRRSREGGWGADIAYVRLRKQFAYLAVVM